MTLPEPQSRPKTRLYGGILTAYSALVPLVFTHPQRPSEGHYFPDPSGVTLRADSVQLLIEAVTEYRLKNSLHPGNPYAEIEAFYAKQFPWLVTKVGITPAPMPDAVSIWVDRMWKERIQSTKFVDSEIAEARAKVCENCPHHDQNHRFIGESTRRLIMLGAGRLHAMGACKVHQWAPGLALLYADPHTPCEVEGCWAGSRRGELPPSA
jgi:hypothetical protein